MGPLPVFVVAGVGAAVAASSGGGGGGGGGDDSARIQQIQQ